MTTSFSSFKAEVAAYLTEALPQVGVSAPVVPFLPDDVTELPVVMVGRTGLQTSEGVFGHFTVWVDAVGRRLNDQDAQEELDALNDGLLWVLSVLPAHLELISIEPVVQVVAGVEYPCQRATVATTDRLICGSPFVAPGRLSA